MTGLCLAVTQWLGGPTTPEEFTIGELRIEAEGFRPFTEVQDSIALTTRETIRVPAVALVHWLLTGWWRLCWEPVPNTRTRAWRRAHSMAALGDGFAWPALEIAGDGEFVQFSMRRELTADVAAIRYLNEIVGCDIAVDEFASAVERFCDEVEGRLASSAGIGSDVVRSLRDELRSERQDPNISKRCRREARAGFDPGEAPDEFFASVERIAQQAGETAVEDLLVVERDIASLRSTFEAVKNARTKVNLGEVPRAPATATGTKPWQRGALAAQKARKEFAIPGGPISKEKLGEILHVHLPVAPDLEHTDLKIAGGFRSPNDFATARVLVHGSRLESQRFFFARLLGLAAMPTGDPLLPITDGATVLQKFGRSFAQELLCPWSELQAWTDENGVGEDSIQRAAEHYEVSEMLITSTLVNRGKLDRERLARFVV